MTEGRRRLGAYGEQRAVRWYEAAGWRVLDRNWRCREGELDLVVARGAVIAFVEVKTRASAAYGGGFEAVTWAKQQRLRRLAVSWLRATGHHADELRFDVVSIVRGQLEVCEGAF